jgi:hypothetical protein
MELPRKSVQQSSSLRETEIPALAGREQLVGRMGEVQAERQASDRVTSSGVRMLNGNDRVLTGNALRAKLPPRPRLQGRRRVRLRPRPQSPMA